MGTIYNKQNLERLDVEENTKETYKEIKENIKNTGFTTCGDCMYCKYADECNDSYIKKNTRIKK